MKFRKIAALAAALSICTAGFSACGNDSSDTQETTAATTASDVPAVTDDTETVSDTESGKATDSEETTVSPLLDAVQTSIEGLAWPVMEPVTDKDFIADFFLLDTENANYKAIAVMQCPMSANLTEMIVIEADDVSSAKADLEARKKKAQEQDAFYPDDVERAGAAIVGTEGSYAYFIMGNEPEKAEEALLENLG